MCLVRLLMITIRVEGVDAKLLLVTAMLGGRSWLRLQMLAMLVFAVQVFGRMHVGSEAKPCSWRLQVRRVCVSVAWRCSQGGPPVQGGREGLSLSLSLRVSVLRSATPYCNLTCNKPATLVGTVGDSRIDPLPRCPAGQGRRIYVGWNQLSSCLELQCDTTTRR